MKLKVYTHAFQLLSGLGIKAKDGRHPKVEHLECVLDAALVEKSGVVLWMGKTRDLPKKYLKEKRIDLKHSRSLMPGMIDCHTHLVFAGDRSDEFASRCAGVSYEEIAKQGGGILSTVKATRKATEAELFKLAQLRVKEMWARGVRAIEVKSGYGLELETEIKCLSVVKKLKKFFPEIVFHSTFLGAHAIPSDAIPSDAIPSDAIPSEMTPRKVTSDQYTKVIIDKMLPAIAKLKLADSCDVFTEKGYFSISQSRSILQSAKKLGFQTRVHADELSDLGGAKLAVEMKSLSADHLLEVSDEGIRALAASHTVAVLLPGTAFFLKANYAPARKLIDSGACVALATDFNPGTCMTTSLPFIMSLAALQMQMTKAEIFAAVTYNSAKALKMEDEMGTLEIGKKSYPIITPFKSFEESYYRFGW